MPRSLSPNWPNERACCPSPGSTLPRPRQEPANLRIEPTIFPSGSQPKFGDSVRRVLPGAATGAPTGLGPGAPQTIESQVHFHTRRLVPDSLNQQHETRPRNTSVLLFARTPWPFASCLSRNRDFGNGIDEGSRPPSRRPLLCRRLGPLSSER